MVTLVAHLAAEHPVRPAGVGEDDREQHHRADQHEAQARLRRRRLLDAQRTRHHVREHADAQAEKGQREQAEGEQERRVEAEARDQALRDDLENAVLAFSMATDGNDAWLALRQRFKKRGFDLPERLYYDEGPFYVLQAAYSAKHGKPVACGHKNLMGLANSLFNLHKDALWAFSVMLGHYDRGRNLIANGNVEGWRKKRDQYREGWLLGDDAFEPDHRYDDLLAFLFPDAADQLRQSPGQSERLRRRRLASRLTPSGNIR